jgi:LysR family transcriptional regulator, hydrogen peroxide-inducible genes activator
MPTITQLQYIVTVEKLRHFGNAAKACHVSQPSLSAQIHKVEAEVGLTIFDRGKKPVIPTEKGKLFISQAKVLLREHDKLIQISKEQAGELSGDFRLGIIPTLAPYVLPLFIEEFSTRFPKVNLRVDEMKTDTCITELKQDKIDAAIAATPLVESSLFEKILFYEPFYLYVGSDHNLGSRKRVSESDLDANEMWLLQDGHCLRTQVVKFCSLKSPKGVFRNIQFEGGNLETLRYLVKKSQGYTLLPHLFARTLPENEQRTMLKPFESPAPTREVSLVYHRDQWKADILHAVQSTIMESLPPDLRTELNKKKAQLLPAR